MADAWVNGLLVLNYENGKGILKEGADPASVRRRVVHRDSFYTVAAKQSFVNMNGQSVVTLSKRNRHSEPMNLTGHAVKKALNVGPEDSDEEGREGPTFKHTHYQGTGQNVKYNYDPNARGAKSILNKSKFVRDNVLDGKAHSIGFAGGDDG